MSETVNTVNPTTEQPVAEYTLMSEAEANQAVDSANTAFLSWKKTSFAERAKIDEAYCRNLSFREDLNILFRTVGVILRSTGY